MIVTGHSVHVSVRKGCLIIRSNTGETRLERVPRVHDRLVLAGNVGLITIEAMAWLEACELPWCVLWRGELLAGNHDGKGDPETHRAQATADPLPITRYLLAAKLRGQARNAEMMRAPDAAKYLSGYADKLGLREDLLQITGIEGKGAKIYWDLWRERVTVPFVADHMLKVPPRWIRFVSRDSLYSNRRARQATDPVNALLNYAYRIGETLCVEACYEHGMSPVIGPGHPRKHIRLVHGETPRNSMALDLLEAVRPACDRVVLELLDYGQGIRPYLKWHDFLELETGVVRVESSALRERIIRECELFRGEVSGFAREVKAMLCNRGK